MYVAPDFAAISAWLAEKQRVTLVATFFFDKATQAFSPSIV